MAEGPFDGRMLNDASPRRNTPSLESDLSTASDGGGVPVQMHKVVDHSSDEIWPETVPYDAPGSGGAGGEGGESSSAIHTPGQLRNRKQHADAGTTQKIMYNWLGPELSLSEVRSLRREHIGRDRIAWRRISREEQFQIITEVLSCQPLLITALWIFIFTNFSLPLCTVGIVHTVISVFWITETYIPLGLYTIWKYHFWVLVGTILKFNKAMALNIADFTRRMIPHLAPCNALQDDVGCTATTSTFIAKSTCIYGIEYGVVDIDDRYKQGVDSSKFHDFKIGGGLVSVTNNFEDQYRFTCEARGRFLEDFMVGTDWESIARVLSILRLWEASPKVGVVENLTLWRGDIYCHALNVKEIVEGVLKSPSYFSIFHFSEEKRFFVGCGRGGTVVSKVIYVLTYGISLMVAVASYYQLKESNPKVATGSLVILSATPFFIIIIEILGPLFTKSCFYWLCTLFCCNNPNRRLRVYNWLKEIGSSLPYCDDFEPDRLLLEDGKVNVNCLHKSVYKSREPFGVPFAETRSPDWTCFATIDFDNLSRHGDEGPPWTSITEDNDTIKFKLFKADDNFDAVTFMMEFTCSSIFKKSSRMIHVRSEFHKESQSQGYMYTQVSVNGWVTILIWSESSFRLFVYLLLMWGKTNHGVIESYENFMFRTYYHVFSVHGLAEHIEKHGLETYLVLRAGQTTEPVRTISRPVLAAKKVVDVITERCSWFQASHCSRMRKRLLADTLRSRSICWISCCAGQFDHHGSRSGSLLLPFQMSLNCGKRSSVCALEMNAIWHYLVLVSGRLSWVDHNARTLISIA